MSESDDKLLRHYRLLSRDEPPSAIDAAILAASRRAVASRPWSQRLAGPVSIAAVLVLAVGVTLNMQREQPGVEVAAPASEYSVPGAAPETTPPAPQAAPPADAFRSDALERKAKTSPGQKIPAERTLKKEAASAPAPVATEAARPEPRAFSLAPAPETPAAAPARATTTTPSVATPPAPSLATPSASALTAPPTPALAAPPAPAFPASGAARAPQPEAPPPAQSAMKQSAVGELRAKRELADAAAPSGQASAMLALPDPAAELERIARLRGEGRHEDADKALEAFVRKHPDYRIPDAVWNRVKPR